ncbi:MAG TPA: FGGY-family carbohydrate kinase [Vicinamibacterales bacterium]|jgi:xylulokinase
MPLYLGFDSSTQSLTATVIETGRGRREIVFEHAINFDETFPEFDTTNGVVRGHDGVTVTTPPALWVAALDRMAGILAGSGVDLTRIAAISGSGQQHGSVYLTADATQALASLDPDRPLVDQITPVLSRRVSPVWLDCSTGADCAVLTRALGGGAAVAALTGSRAYERFTGAQIHKFAEQEPAGYARTDRIHLVSSFMASLLAGRHAPIDPGDGAGMNLMDLAARTWAPRALDAAAPDLARRMPEIKDSWAVVGTLAPYWQTKYGFGPAKVIAWSGDNPCSLIGLGLIEAGQLGISLGTSDTVFGPVVKPVHDPQGTGHVFGSPAGGYMALTCFANGSLARERVRDLHRLDWSGFSRLLADTAPGNGGGMLAPWFVPEITPPVPDAQPRWKDVAPTDAPRAVRAVVEGQAMAMRIHSRWIAPTVSTIRVTGGAAENAAILQVIADVFDAELVRIAPRNAASLGAALRAFHADCLASRTPRPWHDVIDGFTDPNLRVTPDAAAAAIYKERLPEYERFTSG